MVLYREAVALTFQQIFFRLTMLLLLFIIRLKLHIGKTRKGKSSRLDASRELSVGARQLRNADELALELPI